MIGRQYNLRAGYYHEYTGIGRCTDENLTTNKVVDLLNEQDEQIKELEKDLNDALNRIEERSIDVQLLKEENGNLKKENELKGDFRNFINEDIVRIKKENEQLKEEVERLKCINKQLEERLDKDIALDMDCGEVE